MFFSLKNEYFNSVTLVNVIFWRSALDGTILYKFSNPQKKKSRSKTSHGKIDIYIEKINIY